MIKKPAIVFPIFLLAAALLFGFRQTASAAFSNVGSAEGVFSGVTSASDTVSVAVPDLGANRIGVLEVLNHTIGIGYSNATATWNGVAMTESVPDVVNGGKGTSIFTLVGAADNGTYNISVDYGAGDQIHTTHMVVTWADATDAISVDDTSVATGTSQNPAVTITQANANELVISGSVSAANAIAATSTTGCTELQNADSGGNTSISCYSQPASAGDTTHTHNYSESEVYAMAGISFKEEGGAPAAPDAGGVLLLFGNASWESFLNAVFLLFQ
ncbi:MAG TPA: hypothetical protein VJB18_03825 [Burkholderiales bacterium]|nr:hypothetical protein [Burkholderiales bacterium]